MANMKALGSAEHSLVEVLERVGNKGQRLLGMCLYNGYTMLGYDIN